jgi:hypothetical protein
VIRTRSESEAEHAPPSPLVPKPPSGVEKVPPELLDVEPVDPVDPVVELDPVDPPAPVDPAPLPPEPDPVDPTTPVEPVPLLVAALGPPDEPRVLLEPLVVALPFPDPPDVPPGAPLPDEPQDVAVATSHTMPRPGAPTRTVRARIALREREREIMAHHPSARSGARIAIQWTVQLCDGTAARRERA